MHRVNSIRNNSFQLVKVASCYTTGSLYSCFCLSNPFGINRVNEGGIVNNTAPMQPLIKAASNEGSLIDTAGLASPLASINCDSHMMRLMTGSHEGR